MVPRVLVACEYSGKVRRAFRAMGCDAWSCDLLDADDGSPHHYKCDVTGVLMRERWDCLVSHPPCTFLCNSGLHWNARKPGRAEQTEAALRFVRFLLDAPVKFKALENPVGVISTRIRRPDQIVQPWQYGDDASKSTCLWLENLPRLRSTSIVSPRLVRGLPRWANQTDSGQNRLPPSEDRWKIRSETYAGIANAMAAQWTPVLKALR